MDNLAIEPLPRQQRLMPKFRPAEPFSTTMSNHRPSQTHAGEVTRPLAMLGRPSPAAQPEDNWPVHREALIQLALRAHVRHLWAGFIMSALWPWIWRSPMSADWLGWLVGRRNSGLKPGRSRVRERKTLSKRWGTWNDESVRKSVETRITRGHNSERASARQQEQEESKQRGVVEFTSRAIVSAYGIVEVWVEVRASEADKRERTDGLKRVIKEEEGRWYLCGERLRRRVFPDRGGRQTRRARL